MHTIESRSFGGICVHDYVIASDVFDVYFVQCSSIFVLHVQEKQQGLLIHVHDKCLCFACFVLFGDDYLHVFIKPGVIQGLRTEPHISSSRLTL